MRRGQESWEEYRQRLLDETSRFIEWGLNHPAEVEWIPMKPAGADGFPRQVSRWFWTVVLYAESDSRLTRWREWLLRRPPDSPLRR